MNSVTVRSVLEYYDGPQVLDLRGNYGASAVGIRLPEEYGKGAFLVVLVEPERMTQFKWGALDLRDLILEATAPEWYIGEPVADASQMVLSLTRGDGPLARFDALPLAGFRLEQIAVTSELERHAQQSGHLVAELAVASVREPHRATLPFSMWIAVQRACNRVLSSCARLAKSGALEPQFAVVAPALAGSVKILVQSDCQMGQLFGDTYHARALAHLDELLSLADEPEATIAYLRNQRGSLPGTYLKLLKVLEKNELHFYHEWIDPMSHGRGGGRLQHETTHRLYQQLSEHGVSEGYEELVQGTLEQIDLKTGTWRLQDRETSNTYSGTGGLPEAAHGLVVGGVYRFLCQVTPHEDPLTGRVVEKFELTSVLKNEDSR